MVMNAHAISRTVRDGDFELVEWDPATGRTVWAMFDGEKVVFRTDVPVAQAIESNLLARNDAPDGWKGDYHRIASVPMQLLYDENIGLNKAIQQGDDAHISRWLNSSDNRAWRTKEGSV